MEKRDLLLFTGYPCTGKSTIELNMRRLLCGTIAEEEPVQKTSKWQTAFIGPTLGHRGHLLQTCGAEYLFYNESLTPTPDELEEYLERARYVVMSLTPGYEPMLLLAMLSPHISQVHEFSFWSHDRTEMSKCRTQFFSGRDPMSKKKGCSAVRLANVWFQAIACQWEQYEAQADSLKVLNTCLTMIGHPEVPSLKLLEELLSEHPELLAPRIRKRAEYEDD